MKIVCPSHLDQKKPEPVIVKKPEEQDPGIVEGVVGAGLGAAAGLATGVLGTVGSVLGGAALGGGAGLMIGGK